MTPFAPEAFRDRLIESFRDSASPAYGQVATVGSAGEVQVRTVHLRYVEEFETLGFAANRLSPKWTQLLQNPKLSGCWFDTVRMKQYRWQGEVQLISPDSAVDGERKILDRMWKAVRPTVRNIYWYDHLGVPYDDALPKGTNIEEICPSFGVVLLRPKAWDYYEVLDEDYRKHRRSVHKIESGAWKSERVAILTAKPV